MSILANAVAIAFESAATVAGCALVYVRGATEIEITNAIVGTQTVLQSSEYDNLINKRHKESFLLPTCDLRDAIGEPAAGDQIRYVPDNSPETVLIFTIRPDDQGGPCFRPTDRYHTRWRVNTILTGKEAA
jgi:hypothetical protein